MGGGSCGCCSCSCTREVERDFYNFTLLSADETIKHWEAAVDAGRNILWDALSRVMEQSASETMDEYGKALEHSEKLMLKALEAQFDVLKQDKKAILQEAQSVQQKMQTQVKAFSGLQKEVLGGHILQRARDSND